MTQNQLEYWEIRGRYHKQHYVRFFPPDDAADRAAYKRGYDNALGANEEREISDRALSLFGKYVLHVVDREGVDFLGYAGSEFTQDEVIFIRQLAAREERKSA